MKTPTITRGITASLLLAALAPPAAWAETSSIVANISRILIDSNYYGGCMVALTVSPTTALPSCAETWVTFDCDGNFPNANPVKAWRMLDQAQLAFATNKLVYLLITDQLKANGHCYASRIDVY